MGEFSTLTELRKILPKLPRGWIGPGDDCAFVPYGKNESLTISTDALLEGIHFFPNIALEDLLHKALQVNLSDLAAKGARPMGCFFSVGLPRKRKAQFAKILKIFAHACREAGVPLLGGDSTASRSGLVLNITVLGLVKNAHIKLRAHVRPGQIVAVAGFLGDSGAGLELLRSRRKIRGAPGRLIRRHLRPQALLKEGQFLVAQKEVRAMMDVSDGLASDLQRLGEMSKCGFVIDVTRLPLSDSLRASHSTLQRTLTHYALEGGEDYALLMSVQASSFEALRQKFEKKFPGTPLTAIGRAQKKGAIEYFRKSQPLRQSFRGYDHFR